MRAFLPWLRTIIAIVLGIVAIEMVHLAGGQLFPAAYDPSSAGPWLVIFIALMLLAGIAGTFTTVLVSRHRPWLHIALFFLLMLALDVAAMFGVFSERDTWFKAFVLLSLPLQAWLGGRLALLAWPQPARRPA